MSEVERGEVDPGRTFPNPHVHVGGGLASGGFVGQRPVGGSGISRPNQSAMVTIDYMGFLEQAKALAVKEMLFKVLEAVEAVSTKLPGSLNWEDKQRKASDIKLEIAEAIKALM